MSKIIRSAYLLVNTPVHIGRPLQVGFVQSNKWSDDLFDKYVQSVESNRKLGGYKYHLRKKEIEQWGFMPPCGARFEVIQVELPISCDHRPCRYNVQ